MTRPADPVGEPGAQAPAVGAAGRNGGGSRNVAGRTAGARAPGSPSPGAETASRPAVSRFAAALGFTADQLRPGATTDDPLRVVVICGGPGPERAVSLAGGPAVQAALKERGHDAVRLELPEAHEDCVDALMTLDGRHATGPGGRPVEPFDVAFLVLHGPFGEDGRVQTVLDRLGLPYTGSGVWSSILSWRKRLSKRRWAEEDLPTAPWAVVVRGSLGEGELPGDAEEWPLPFVVKPDAGGSSVGVSVVHELSQLTGALAAAHAHDDLAVAEQFVPGEEWSVPVLGRTALPPLRIVPPGGAGAVFDFAAKYEDPGTVIEAVTDGAGESARGDVAAAAADLAVRAAEALFADGLVRVDLRVAPDDTLWLLELNASPGLSAASQVPRSAAAAGVPAGLLYERCCRTALGEEPGEGPADGRAGGAAETGG